MVGCMEGKRKEAFFLFPVSQNPKGLIHSEVSEHPLYTSWAGNHTIFPEITEAWLHGSASLGPLVTLHC